MKDLVILVADKNAQFALKGALGRPESPGIRHIEFEFRVHPGRDRDRTLWPFFATLQHREFRGEL